MKKLLGTGIWLFIMASLFLVSPLVPLGFNAAFRPDYHLRNFASEYMARLLPNRVYWTDYKAFQLTCPGGKKMRVVVLDTGEFSEPARDYVRDSFAPCENPVLERKWPWRGFFG